MIVTLTGKKGSGKDTVGAHLKKYGFKRFALADPLKEACKILFNLSDEQVYHNKEEVSSEWNLTPREILQFVGTEMFRDTLPKLIPNIKNDFWAINLKGRIEEYLQKNPDAKIVVTDVRFPNELKVLNSINAKLISCSIVSNHHWAETSLDSHPSETQIVQTTHTIENNSSLKELYLQVDQLLKKL